MTLLQIISYLGIFIFALTGALKARSHRMDVFGGLVLAFVSAYGGGTIRDLLIGVRPVNWINDNIALALVFSATLITFFLKDNANRFKRTIFYTDAAGLGLFTATGIEVSIMYGLNDMYALIMGVITATFGGLVADIFSNSVPNLFKRGELYATACALGGMVYMILKNTSFNPDLNLTVCVLFVIGVRIYSKRNRLMLPDI